MSSDFSDAKAYLQQDGSGANLYNHISEVILKLITEKPENPLEMFEHLSSVVQRSSFNAGKGVGSSTDGEAKDKADSQKKNWVETSDSLYPTEDSTESESVTKIVPQLHLLRNAGVGISSTDAFRLDQSMNKLAEADESITSLRYWGKIKGISNDYHILEGDADGSSPEETTKEAEQKGPNYKTYWASTRIGEASSWTKLPSVTSNQVAIVVSGNLRRFFTGDLSAQVSGHPVYAGNEASFLRATIAVIDSQTALAPQGKYTSEDEESPNTLSLDEGADELEYKSIELSTVTHLRAGIGQKGRVKTWVDKGDDGEDLDNEYNQSNPSDDIPALRDVDEEQWSASNGGLKSKEWPGFTAIAANNDVTNIYIGWGVKSTKTAHTPVFPLDIAAEFDDADIREEADNLDAPVVENDEENDNGED